MLHLGDITKISGYEVPIVDVVVGGSPCQDLSAAGKRAGLAGENSSLFMEQIRIIKEMRENDMRSGRTACNARPRYMVWENVPGAFSSNKGEDFRVVLEETAKVADENAVIPSPPKRKWTTSGCIMGNGWSVAWRVLDAQFWGVPQRRRRIALVADFGGESAPEILFIRKSMSGNTGSSKQERQTTSANVRRSTGATDRKVEGFDGYNGALTGAVSATIGTNCGMSTGRNGVITFEPGIASREGGHIYEKVCGTLRANAGDKQMSIVYSVDQGGGKSSANIAEGKTATLACTHGGEPVVCYEQPKFHYIVRRLTPTECERLQGYPDGWTNAGKWIDTKGKTRKTSDTARYKALGNSIAIPPWRWVIKRISACYERNATLASLFDGIGGFPYIWEQINGKGSCLWASEIEEFPIAVTKKRIGGD